ncbi:MAG: alanyl-tRNA editing protein [Candidatus Nanoarchaeia archaeon]|nr:alanyl-tRNA editing protein [Candidatus Nanoarchaeia archaeon]
MPAKYLEDSYKREFESIVKSVRDKYVILEESYFYPNSGGQPFDTGVLVDEHGNKYNVVYVAKTENEISHEVDKEGLKEGMKVKGLIDWERRHLLMRYHTVSHILSQFLYKETGALITGNQLGLDKSRVDFSLENFDRDLMMSFESKVNEFLSKNREVKTYFLPREKAMELPVLSKLAKGLNPDIKDIRIVEIKDFDITACGGTHVKNTSEIGKIKITKLENKGGNRRRICFVLI